MTTNQTQPNPAPSPDAQPVQAVDPSTMQPLSPYATRLLAERDGYRQALETEKTLRAADVRELRAALEAVDRLASCQSDNFTDLSLAIGECRSVARAALQLARGTK